MKKIISIVLLAAMVFTCFAFSSSASTSDGNHGFLLCDANDDEYVNMKDVLLIRRFIANTASAKAINVLSADANSDSAIDMKDVIFIRRVIAGMADPAGNNTDGKYKVDTVTVGGRNISRYDILIPADADECMTYSAKILRNYIESACGIKLNIVNARSQDSYYIEYVKDTEDRYSLGDEGYHVEVGDDGDILFTCGRLRGALYVSYYFLEKFIGWRFLNDDVEYLYRSENANVPLGFTDEEVPVFVYRGLNQIGTTDDDFAPLRLNAVDAKGSGRAQSYKYGGGVGNLYIHGHSYEYQEAVGRKLDEAGITDLDSDEAKEIFRVYAYNSSEHYAYVSSMNLSNTQPCLTDDKTFDHIMAFNYLLYKERTILGNHVPGIYYTQLSCSPNDTTAFCTCSNCKKVYSEEGSIAGAVFRMSNRVAEAQRKIMPGVGVYTIAYWDARNPPKYTRPDDDVCVCFCFGGCNNHTYDRVEECEACGGNERYPIQIWDVEKQEPARPDFNLSNVYDLDCYNKWTELTNNIWIWYYATNFAYYIAPCPNVLNIYNDYKYLAETGTAGVYTEGSNTGYTFEVLRGYLAARMMWDPFMSEEEFEAYLDEFLMIYYGDGWQYIKEYVYMQDTCGNLQGCFVNNFDRPWNFYNKEYFGENYDRMLELFNMAYDAAKTQTQKDRIEKARVHVYFLGLSATYDSNYLNGNAEQIAKYKEQYSYLWNYIKKGGYRCVDIGESGIAGLGNFPSSANDVYDTMFWIMDGFYGDGR
ncbi:MAG: DUF4838 domain-containing protein [Clostridia bacterium]|nr:DUF4838 domain-containing protein [Clostridia bacterium]